MFEPFPPYFLKDREIRSKAGFFDGLKDGQGGGAADDKNKNFFQLIALVRSLPPFKGLKANSESEETLKEMLKAHYAAKESKDPHLSENLHIAAYKLMQFVVQNDPLTLDLVEGPRALFPDQSSRQYVVISPPSAKERSFQAEKEKHGSHFVWHGSGVENWYSIIRNGLRVLSNTKLMTAGAAYGKGVYSAN